MKKTVKVNLEDLRLLLKEASPFLVTEENRDAPVVWAIDRLGDKVALQTIKNYLGKEPL